MIYVYDENDQYFCSAVIVCDRKPEPYIIDALAQKADSITSKEFNEDNKNIHKWVKENKETLKPLHDILKTILNKFNIKEEEICKQIDSHLSRIYYSQIEKRKTTSQTFITLLRENGYEAYEFNNLANDEELLGGLK